MDIAATEDERPIGSSTTETNEKLLLLFATEYFGCSQMLILKRRLYFSVVCEKFDGNVLRDFQFHRKF